MLRNAQYIMFDSLKFTHKKLPSFFIYKRILTFIKMIQKSISQALTPSPTSNIRLNVVHALFQEDCNFWIFA